MNQINIKTDEDILILQFKDLSQQEAEYWEGIYLKQLYYNTIQLANRNYAYIDKNIISQMLPEDWYIDFYVKKSIAFFEIKNFKDYYRLKWYGESIALQLINSYPLKFTKINL